VGREWPATGEKKSGLQRNVDGACDRDLLLCCDRGLRCLHCTGVREKTAAALVRASMLAAALHLCRGCVRRPCFSWALYEVHVSILYALEANATTILFRHLSLSPYNATSLPEKEIRDVLSAQCSAP